MLYVRPGEVCDRCTGGDMRSRVSGLKAASALIVLAVMLVGSRAAAHPQKTAESSNMELVGYNDLQGRSSYHPAVQKQGSRWIVYVGHHGGENLNSITGKKEVNGTSVVDVTDPKAPKYIAHIPGDPGQGSGQEAGGAQMVRVCPGSSLPHGDKGK